MKVRAKHHVDHKAMPAYDQECVKTSVRDYEGSHHQMRVKQLGRELGECNRRYSECTSDTVDQVRHVLRRVGGRLLRYRDLTASVETRIGWGIFPTGSPREVFR